MNIVMDLASRAVSFIILIQDTALAGTLNSKRDNSKLDIDKIFSPTFPSAFPKYLEESSGRYKEKFSERSLELVWISKKKPDKEKAKAYTLHLCYLLAEWIDTNKIRLFNNLKKGNNFPTPHHWREAIMELLHADKDQHLHLAAALQYLPIQIVLALGGGKLNVRSQRILQLWKISDEDISGLLTDKEINAPLKSHYFTEKNAEELLLDETKLVNHLIEKDAPLSFELVFKQELEEINANRKIRYQELCHPTALHSFEKESAIYNEIKNPFGKAKAMKLYALALSGGGIRSATFNLGILQGLAKEGFIGKLDYLSTVSGGGYIGSWLAAWIKRDGSVTKVSDRLNPDKSPDPFGEELWPIRWLRMFSNYFTPQSSIMSVDSWTVGVTWIRNMLLNQLIILLLLLSLFLTIRILFDIWVSVNMSFALYTEYHVLIWSIAFFLPVSFLAGVGMQSYHEEKFPPSSIKREASETVSRAIVLICLIGAFIVSSVLFSHSHFNLDLPKYNLREKIILLKYDGFVIFISLLLIAVYGRYDKCIESYKVSQFGTLWYIFISAALSALSGVLGLAFCWQLLEFIKQHTDGRIPKLGVNTYTALAFTIGIPLLVNVLGLIVGTRMVILGKYFPDERREWWGRMGASVNRFSFIFALLAVFSLLGYSMFSWITGWQSALTAGTWVALVGTAVQAAFSSKSSGKEGSKGVVTIIRKILSLAGPYIFALGLLVFIPALIEPILRYNRMVFDHLGFKEWNDTVKTGILTACLFTGAYLLARRVGVNEFSMHHFYRNRLIRAYLGATRRRPERQGTSNPFTNFDMWDDEKLSLFRNERNYYGPYPILNAALNASQVSQLDRQDRKAESFIFSPLFCGFDFSKSRASDDVSMKSYDYGFRKTEHFAYEDKGPGIGTAMAISGAAINPNHGYHSSSATAFLLTVFNVQMGWWIGNPRKSAYRFADPRSGLAYIIYNLLGKTNTRRDFVNLSDGGHFDNMGLYELIRRRVSFIILGDAEQDDKFTCEGLANTIRRCRIDFGTEITIDTEKITERDEKHFSKKSYTIGTIKYADDEKPSGRLLYIKSSIAGKLPVDVGEYALKNKAFPHQTTGDQFFDEEQFESYRRLGLYIAEMAMSDDDVRIALEEIAPFSDETKGKMNIS